MTARDDRSICSSSLFRSAIISAYGDRGYDANWFREALKGKGIRACIPGRKQRMKAVKCDKRRYKRRNRVEIMFGSLKD